MDDIRYNEIRATMSGIVRSFGRNAFRAGSQISALKHEALDTLKVSDLELAEYNERVGVENEAFRRSLSNRA